MKVEATTGQSSVNDSTATLHKDLRALLAGLTPVAAPSVTVTDLSLDSRRMSAGGAFVALPGTRTHGIEFASQAIANGASIVLWEPTATVTAAKLPPHIVACAIPALTELLGPIADRFFDEPSKSMSVVRHHGNERQDDDGLCRCRCVRKAWSQVCVRRHARIRAR